jgi:hypothetical protein
MAQVEAGSIIIAPPKTKEVVAKRRQQARINWIRDAERPSAFMRGT